VPEVLPYLLLLAAWIVPTAIAYLVLGRRRADHQPA
jgi:hypothetical protein